MTWTKSISKLPDRIKSIIFYMPLVYGLGFFKSSQDRQAYLRIGLRSPEVKPVTPVLTSSVAMMWHYTFPHQDPQLWSRQPLGPSNLILHHYDDRLSANRFPWYYGIKASIRAPQLTLNNCSA